MLKFLVTLSIMNSWNSTIVHTLKFLEIATLQWFYWTIMTFSSFFFNLNSLIWFGNRWCSVLVIIIYLCSCHVLTFFLVSAFILQWGWNRKTFSQYMFLECDIKNCQNAEDTAQDQANSSCNSNMLEIKIS